MRVTFNQQHGGAATLQTAARELALAQRAVTTGRRVLVASDDPLAARTIVQERAEMAGLDAYKHSAETAASRLAAADTALSGIIELYTQAQTTTAAARGTTATPAARAALAAEVRGLRASVLTQINAQFGGRPLFAGGQAEGQAYAGVPGAWTYQGTADTIQLEVQRERLVSITFDGQSILQGSDPQNVLESLDALADAIEAGDQAGMVDGLGALDRAFQRATRAQGRLGADDRGVADAVTQLNRLRLASESRRSASEDANMAEAITRLSEADTAYRAALAAVSREERQSLLDYLK